MRQFKRLKTDNGDVRIVEKSAELYKDIGTKLLTAELVDSISEVANEDPKKAIRLIYRIWMRTDKSHSWGKLTQCFNDVGLKSLARDLEKHFGLPSPSGKYNVLSESLRFMMNRNSLTLGTHAPKGLSVCLLCLISHLAL